MTSKHKALPLQYLYGLMVFLSLLSWSCEETGEFRTIEPDNNVLQTIRDQDNLSQFNAALELTDLSSTLRNQNVSFTVFAPTNQAFDTYLANQGYSDIAAVPAEELNNLLNYHIALGKKQAAALDSAMLINTLSNKDIFVYKTSGAGNVILNNEATIVSADLQGGNGVVHIIDEVLTPPAQSLAQYIASRAADESAPEFTFLQAAIERADLFTVLNGDHPFTLLAPTDNAFMAAGYENTDSIQSEDPALLRNILFYHLLPNYYYSFMLPNGEVNTQLGKQLSFNTATNTVTGVGNEQPANLLPNQLDIRATNGLLHTIDRVLLPQPQ